MNLLATLRAASTSRRAAALVVDDDHGDIHRLSDPQQAAHGLRLRKSDGSGGWEETPISPGGASFSLDKGVDDAAVFAVYATMPPFSFSFSGAWYMALSPIIAGMSHIHLEGGDSGSIPLSTSPPRSAGSSRRWSCGSRSRSRPSAFRCHSSSPWCRLSPCWGAGCRPVVPVPPRW